MMKRKRLRLRIANKNLRRKLLSMKRDSLRERRRIKMRKMIEKIKFHQEKIRMIKKRIWKCCFKSLRKC